MALTPPPATLASAAPAWVEVGRRRRPSLEKVAAPPPRKDAGLPRTFKQRTFGLCFRCLASDHFVAGCHGPVRCLGCGHSGHRERECLARHPAGSEPRRPPPPSRLPGLVSGLPPAADRLQPHFIDLVALGLRWFLIKTALRLMVSCRRLTPACLLLFWSPCGLSLQLRRRRSALSYRPCSLLVLRCCSSLFKTWLLLWRVGLLKSQAYGNLWKLSGAAKTLPMLNLLLLLWPLVRIAVRLLWLAAQLS